MWKEWGQGRDAGSDRKTTTRMKFTREASSQLGDGERERESRERERAGREEDDKETFTSPRKGNMSMARER